MLHPLCSGAPAVLSALNSPASSALGTIWLPANTQPAEPPPICSAICLPQHSLPLHQALLCWKSHGSVLRERDCSIFLIKRERQFWICVTTCSGAPRLTRTQFTDVQWMLLTHVPVHAGPRMTKHCCPPSSILAARFSLPTAAEILPVWDAVFSNTLWGAWLLNRDTSGTPTPSTLPVLLCSAAAEGKWWSRSLGGVPWPGTGHVVGMWVVLQDWGCLSTVEKEKGREAGGSTGQSSQENVAVDSLLGLLRDSWWLLWSPHHETQGWLLVTCAEHTVFFLRKKAGILRRDYIHAWAYLKVLGLFSGFSGLFRLNKVYIFGWWSMQCIHYNYVVNALISVMSFPGITQYSYPKASF